MPFRLIYGLVSFTSYQCSTRNGLDALSHSTYATTNNVQPSSELTASCQTCLHHVVKCHPRHRELLEADFDMRNIPGANLPLIWNVLVNRRSELSEFSF